MAAVLVLLALAWTLISSSATAVSSQGLNTAQLTESGPILLNKDCRFGKPTKGTCKCDGKTLPPEDFICGSDMEIYKSECEFQCALTCNPGLFKHDPACPSLRAAKPRLDFSKREKVHREHFGDAVVDNKDNNNDDYRS